MQPRAGPPAVLHQAARQAEGTREIDSARPERTATSTRAGPPTSERGQGPREEMA